MLTAKLTSENDGVQQNKKINNDGEMSFYELLSGRIKGL
jgi:hypothetical protein